MAARPFPYAHVFSSALSFVYSNFTEILLPPFRLLRFNSNLKNFSFAPENGGGRGVGRTLCPSPISVSGPVSKQIAQP